MNACKSIALIAEGGDRRGHERRDDRRRDENPPEPVILIRMILEDLISTETQNGLKQITPEKSDALVVKVIISNHTVCRILVDNGSSVDILYSYCLEKMEIKKSQLTPNPQPLYGFTGDSIILEGMIKLPLPVGNIPHTSIVMSNFLVVKGGSQFNTVIGRPAFRNLRAVAFIYHQLMKFPTSNGIGQVKGNNTSRG